MINKSVVDALFKACYPSGMECKNCGGKYVSFSEIEENDVVTEIHLNCSKCMKTFVNFIVIDDTKAKEVGEFKEHTCSCGGNCGK